MLRITSQQAKFVNVMQKLLSDMMDEISNVLSDLFQGGHDSRDSTKHHHR